MATKSRLEVLKTYKIFIGGQFPRTESGRYYVPLNHKGQGLANICLCSRKDLRDAIGSARAAFGGWSARPAFNRGQILYRIAEMMEGRKAQFTDELVMQGSSRASAEKEVGISIDRLIYYSGWCDKYQQIFSSVNPVASSHFNFSVVEPMGVVAMLAPQDSSLIGLVSVMAPVMAGGNTCVILASEKKPLCSVTFAEVLATSDLPGGVVNILTGKPEELLPFMADHMDVNAICYTEQDPAHQQMIKEKASMNVKRLLFYPQQQWMQESAQSPYFINDFQEVKTTWHPIENIGGAKAGY